MLIMKYENSKDQKEDAAAVVEKSSERSWKSRWKLDYLKVALT